jgi:hypothetical protein
MNGKPMRPGAAKWIRYALILVAAILWVAGCEGTTQRSAQQGRKPEGAPQMNQTQTAEKTAISIPPIDAAEPGRLETATFATG